MSTIAFLLAALLVIHVYALFPLLLHWRARAHRLPEVQEPAEWPTVSIVIAAHNEAGNLPAKFASLEQLDYPQDRIEWVVVSDGSTDDTVAVTSPWFEGQDNRHLIHYAVPKGKCGALNEGVARASGDIILFMDARQTVSANAAAMLVPYLLDERIGAVSGELVLSEDSSLEAANFGMYWRYEKWIRDNESRLFSTTGATGALYAIRRRDFSPNPIGTLLDDFDTPVGLLEKGLRTIFVPGAYAFDAATGDVGLEFRRKVRNLGGNWQSFMRHRWLFLPWRNRVWLQFLSHKLGRLLVPFALIIALISSVIGAFSGNAFLLVMLCLQLLFYALALASFLDLPLARSKLLKFPMIFMQMNAAALVATCRYFFSSRAISWR